VGERGGSVTRTVKKGAGRRSGLKCHRGEGTAFPCECHRLFTRPRHTEFSAALIRRISRAHVRLSQVDIGCGGG
jgi:hypothetical protein